MRVTWVWLLKLHVPVGVVGRAADRPDELALHLHVVEASPPPDEPGAVLGLPPLLLHLAEVVLHEAHLLLVEDLDDSSALAEAAADYVCFQFVDPALVVSQDTAETNSRGVGPALQTVALLDGLEVPGLAQDQDDKCALEEEEEDRSALHDGDKRMSRPGVLSTISLYFQLREPLKQEETFVFPDKSDHSNNEESLS